MREIDRILSIPTAVEPDYDKVRRYFARTREARFLPSQVAFLSTVLATLDDKGENGRVGALGLIPCGGGKTLSLLCAASLFQRPLVITRKPLFDQFLNEADVFRATHNIADCTLLSFGKLSHASGEAALRDARPDAIFIDEGHLLGRGARAARLWKYVAARRHALPVYVVTGTLMNKSVVDMAVPAGLALRDYSPLPHDGDILKQWAAVLDEDGEPEANDYLAIAPLSGKFGNPREAFAFRLTDCRGVVSSNDGAFDTDVSLAIRRQDPLDFVTPEAAAALKALEDEWILPNGEPIVDALEKYAAQSTLGLGFYHVWPDGAQAQFAPWFDARREWFRVARQTIEYVPGPWDTIGTLAEVCQGVGAPGRAVRTWRAWDAVRHDPPPGREVVWVDSGQSIANHVHAWEAAASWRDIAHGIVWFHNQAVGEALTRLGWPVENPPLYGPVSASMRWASGWNGQSFRTALVLQPPTTPLMAEQLLARLHRHGQTEDVEYTFLSDGPAFARLMRRASAVQESTHAPQRLIFADKVP